MCNFIRSVLKFILFRFIMFPLILLMSPLLFLMANGDCDQAFQATKSLLKDLWDDT